MTETTAIKKPIEKEFAKYEELYLAGFDTDNSILKQVYTHILATKGKQIRPTLTILASTICGATTDLTYFSAISLELLHSASLIHDDVVDETLLRRGKPSVNSAFNNKVAVLSGDYMLSQILSYSNKIDDKRIIESFATLGKALAEGELLQLAKTEDLFFDEKHYLDIITKKTAILFSTCMYAGAISSKIANNQQIEQLRLFGEYLGICFQIKDDIFDYFDSKELGKPTANDIREKKITLPLIHAYNKASKEEQEMIRTMLHVPELSEDTISFLLDFAKNNGGIDYAAKQMELYAQRAIKMLDIFPDNAVKQSLVAVMDYVIKRNK